MNIRNAMPAEDFYTMKVKPDFETSFIPSAFEEITGEYLILANRKGRMDPLFHDTGTYFSDNVANRRNGQMDVVTEDENGYTSYECKYTKAPTGKRVVEEEVQAVKDLEMNIYRLGSVSENGFMDDVDPEEYQLITLYGIYHSLEQ